MISNRVIRHLILRISQYLTTPYFNFIIRFHKVANTTFYGLPVITPPPIGVSDLETVTVWTAHMWFSPISHWSLIFIPFQTYFNVRTPSITTKMGVSKHLSLMWASSRGTIILSTISMDRFDFRNYSLKKFQVKSKHEVKNYNNNDIFICKIPIQ